MIRSPLSNRSNVNVTRWDHKDSSESQPSPHGSLYDAAWVSTSDCAVSPYQTASRPGTPPPLPSFDLDSESPLTRLESPFLYGHGTELTPILEQRSIATLRTGSLSTSDLSSLMHGAPSNASPGTSGKSKVDSTTPLRRPLRRQHSFSLDDLSLVGTTTDLRPRPKTALATPHLGSLARAHPLIEVTNIHAYPQKPTYPPHQQRATPPAVDAWMLQVASETPDDLRRPVGATMVGLRPFRGQRSGHGDMASHPFMRRLGSTRVEPLSEAQTRAEGEPSTPRSRRQRATTRYEPGAQSSTPSGMRYQTLRRMPTPSSTCKDCDRPSDQRWSLTSTIMGHGSGARRGEEWCTRCALRKVIHHWCFCIRIDT